MTPTPVPIPLRRGVLDYSSRTLVMGVINVTPDSFSDGGRFYDPMRAIQHVAAQKQPRLR